MDNRFLFSQQAQLPTTKYSYQS